nr:unnamed protein product [Digitaria exilis]
MATVPPRFAVSAAAPWLVLLLAVAALSFSVPVAEAAELVELTLLANAREKGAARPATISREALAPENTAGSSILR